MAQPLEAQIAALARMSSKQLKAEWVRIVKNPPPPLTTDLLARGIAWHLQQSVHGGLTPATMREIRRLAKDLEEGGKARVTDGRIKAGTRLMREWGGSTHHVLVLENGYLYRDRHYHSLSQIARGISGVHCSGPRFFGLLYPGKARG